MWSFVQRCLGGLSTSTQVQIPIGVSYLCWRWWLSSRCCCSFPAWETAVRLLKMMVEESGTMRKRNASRSTNYSLVTFVDLSSLFCAQVVRSRCCGNPGPLYTMTHSSSRAACQSVFSFTHVASFLYRILWFISISDFDDEVLYCCLPLYPFGSGVGQQCQGEDSGVPTDANARQRRTCCLRVVSIESLICVSHLRCSSYRG